MQDSTIVRVPVMLVLADCYATCELVLYLETRREKFAPISVMTGALFYCQQQPDAKHDPEKASII